MNKTRRQNCRIPRIILALLGLSLIPSFCPPLPAAENKSILTQISVAPVGAYQQAGFTHGPGQWGAGVELGLPINPFVSLRVRNLAFEGRGDWGGSVVDETAVFARAELKPFTADRFFLYGTGGGARHWEIEDWSFGVGLGAEYRFNRNVSLSAGREIRAYFGDHRRDWLTTAALNLRF